MKTQQDLNPHNDASNKNLKAQFVSNLTLRYPQIISANWKTSETLEVTLAAGEDAAAFAGNEQDAIQKLATFSDHIDLMVKKENDAYFKIIELNRLSSSPKE